MIGNENKFTIIIISVVEQPQLDLCPASAMNLQLPRLEPAGIQSEPAALTRSQTKRRTSTNKKDGIIITDGKKNYDSTVNFTDH